MVVRVKADGTAEREGAQIEIGGNERYVPLCRRHFSQALAGAKILPEISRGANGNCSRFVLALRKSAQVNPAP